MRMLYKTRQEFLIKELNRELGDLLTVNTSDAGMHIVAWLPDNFNDKVVSNSAKDHALIVYPLSDYIIKFKQHPALIMGYTAFNETDLKKGVDELRKILMNTTD